MKTIRFQLKWMSWFRWITFSFGFVLYSVFEHTYINFWISAIVSFLYYYTVWSQPVIYQTVFAKSVIRQNHPLVHQLQHEDSQSDVLQPEEGIDENIEESPIRHASHNRTNGDASNPCFHFTERTWDSCRQKYVYKAHCHGAHVACYRAMDRGYSYPACQVVFGFPQSKYNSKCAKLPIDCQCAAWNDYHIPLDIFVLMDNCRCCCCSLAGLKEYLICENKKNIFYGYQRQMSL